MFVRLFRYAKGDPNLPLENFTTEALRSAIEDDPWPMARALRGVRPAVHEPDCHEAAGILRPEDLLNGATGLVPRTQVVLRDVGTLDLVLDVVGPGRPGAVWIEVKAGAGETNGQLRRYRSYIDARRDESLDRALCTLSATPYPCTAWLPWATLWMAVRTSPDISQMWLDFLAFVKEQGVADESLMPMTAREAAALGDAAQLLNKVAKVLEAVHRWGSEQWGTLAGWYLPHQVRSSLYAPLSGSGKLALPVGWKGDPAYFYAGLIEREGEAYWTVYVSMERNAPDVRQKLSEAVKTLDPNVWTPTEHGETLVAAVERAMQVHTHEQAVSWLESRFSELAAAGVMDIVAVENPDHPHRKGRTSVHG